MKGPQRRHTDGDGVRSRRVIDEVGERTSGRKKEEEIGEWAERGRE